MPKFEYKGKTKEGESVREVVEAEDRYAVYDIARENGHEIITIEEQRAISVKSFLNFEKLNAKFSTVKQDELVMFTRNLSAMLNAGLALSRALTVSEKQTKNPKLKKIIASVREHVNEGQLLNEALTEFPRTFSKLYVAMTRAGEESGGLAEALATIALQMERSSNLRKRIKGAMIYPAIVLSVMFLIGVLMMIYVVPTLTTTFKSLDAELPTSTQIIIFTSDFLSEHTVIALGLMILFIASFILALRTRIGSRIFEWFILHLPVIGTIVKETNAARTARTLSSLLTAGVDVVGALSITKDVVQNSYYKEIIDAAAKRVEKGDPLSAKFIEESKLYPVLVGEMVAVGEETGQISDMLKQIADFYEGEVENKTKDLSTIVEPVLMVVIGGVVGFFALAMIAPIYSISDTIG